MLKIGNAIVSLEIFEKKFSCNIQKCKGACCVYGDSGAPLETNEVEILNQVYPLVKPFLRNEAITTIETHGTSVIDSDGDNVTPLVNGKECAYVIFEQGIAKCAIETAYHANVISFQKPVSCHLYPIRITKYTDFDALNYHEWDICKHALESGKKKNTPLHTYLQQPLKRKYGEKWFQQLAIASEEVLKHINSTNRSK